MTRDAIPSIPDRTPPLFEELLTDVRLVPAAIRGSFSLNAAHSVHLRFTFTSPSCRSLCCRRGTKALDLGVPALPHSALRHTTVPIVIVYTSILLGTCALLQATSQTDVPRAVDRGSSASLLAVVSLLDLCIGHATQRRAALDWPADCLSHIRASWSLWGIYDLRWKRDDEEGTGLERLCQERRPESWSCPRCTTAHHPPRAPRSRHEPGYHLVCLWCCEMRTPECRDQLGISRITAEAEADVFRRDHHRQRHLPNGDPDGLQRTRHESDSEHPTSDSNKLSIHVCPVRILHSRCFSFSLRGAHSLHLGVRRGAVAAGALNARRLRSRENPH